MTVRVAVAGCGRGLVRKSAEDDVVVLLSIPELAAVRGCGPGIGEAAPFDAADLSHVILAHGFELKRGMRNETVPSSNKPRLGGLESPGISSRTLAREPCLDNQIPVSSRIGRDETLCRLPSWSSGLFRRMHVDRFQLDGVVEIAILQSDPRQLGKRRGAAEAPRSRRDLDASRRPYRPLLVRR